MSWVPPRQVRRRRHVMLVIENARCQEQSFWTIFWYLVYTMISLWYFSFADAGVFAYPSWSNCFYSKDCEWPQIHGESQCEGVSLLSSYERSSREPLFQDEPIAFAQCGTLRPMFCAKSTPSDCLRLWKKLCWENEACLMQDAVKQRSNFSLSVCYSESSWFLVAT